MDASVLPPLPNTTTNQRMVKRKTTKLRKIKPRLPSSLPGAQFHQPKERFQELTAEKIPETDALKTPFQKARLPLLPNAESSQSALLTSLKDATNCPELKCQLPLLKENTTTNITRSTTRDTPSSTSPLLQTFQDATVATVSSELTAFPQLDIQRSLMSQSQSVDLLNFQHATNGLPQTANQFAPEILPLDALRKEPQRDQRGIDSRANGLTSHNRPPSRLEFSQPMAPATPCQTLIQLQLSEILK